MRSLSPREEVRRGARGDASLERPEADCDSDCDGEALARVLSVRVLLTAACAWCAALAVWLALAYLLEFFKMSAASLSQRLTEAYIDGASKFSVPTVRFKYPIQDLGQFQRHVFERPKPETVSHPLSNANENTSLDTLVGRYSPTRRFRVSSPRFEERCGIPAYSARLLWQRENTI